MTKPTSKEQDAITKKLEAIEVAVCGICFKKNDSCYQDEAVDWMQCISCSLWAHQSCAKQSLCTQFDFENFKCNLCL